jgi:hypothetical protein
MRRNFTCYLDEWKKIYKCGKLANKEWRRDYCSLIGLLISEKYADKEYFSKHIK